MWPKVIQEGWTIRRMESSDLDQVMEIEKTSFITPWSRHSFEEEIQKDQGFSWVAVFDDQVVGYIIGWYVVDEIHIGNLAVEKNWRRKGIAQDLIGHCLDHQNQFTWAILEVRRSNVTAQELYNKLGFCAAGVRRNYYVQEREDAIVMVKQLAVNINQMRK